MNLPNGNFKTNDRRPQTMSYSDGSKTTGWLEAFIYTVPFPHYLSTLGG